MSLTAELIFLVGCVISYSGGQFTSFYDSNGSCNISWADTESESTFKTAINEENFLVYMQITFEGSSMAINGSFQALDASRWVRTRGRQGNGLLFLKEHFEVLSLHSLSFGVQRLEIPLRDNPTGCFFKSRNYSDVQGDLCRLVLTDFNFQTGNKRGASWYDDEKVCNFRIVRANGKPEYICCQLRNDGNLGYSVLEADMWVNVLVTAIFILTVIIALYSPKVIPASFYSMAYGEECFEHRLPTALQIKLLKTRRMDEGGENIVIDAMTLEEMPELGKYVQTMACEEEKLVTIDKVHIKVMKRRLIPEDDVPVDIVHSLYESLVQCKIRRREAFTHCCRSSIFPFAVCDFGKQWHDVLRVIMHFILIGIVCVPYILRLLFYYNVEKPYIDYLRNTARDRRWIYNVIFTGSLTSWLGPDHPFLITIYIVLGLAVLIMLLTMCAGRNITANLIFVLRNCFRDMSDKSRVYQVINWTVKVVLSPFTFLGVVGLLVVPFYWLITIPLVGVILLCNIFPAIYLLIRLIANFFMPYLFDLDITSKTHINFGIRNAAHRIKSHETVRNWFYIDEFNEIVKGTYMYNAKESFNRRYTNICLQGFFTLFCTFVVLSILFLALDVILLSLEIIVYTSIGIILNAKYVFKYVILVLSLLFYARDCIQSVRNKYLAFNKTILPAVRDSSEGVLDVANQDEKEQQNTAFILNVPNKKPKRPRIILRDNTLKWKLHQVIVFLDKYDTPYITESFFFKACEMPYEKCPGRFLENFFKALLEIFIVFIFLLFVALVILAFGENFAISATNQTLATLAGSFIPLLLRKYFFKAFDFSINTSKIKFTTCLNDTIASYTQEWPIADIVPSDSKENIDVKPLDGEQNADATSSDKGDSVKSDVSSLPIKLVILCDSVPDNVLVVDDGVCDNDDVVVNVDDTDSALVAETKT